MPSKRAIYRYFRDLDDVAIDTLYLCLADYLAQQVLDGARGYLQVLDRLDLLCRVIPELTPTSAR